MYLCFTDVAASHWAAGYVNVASNYGIIKGVGANMFAPDKEVTVAEFYTMAIRSINAGPVAEAEGTWPTNYVNFAIENKLAEDVAQIYTATATRMTAATIVANTLEANMWKKGAVKNGEITWNENTGVNILNSVLNIAEFDHVLIGGVNSKELEANFDNSATYASTAEGYFKETAYDVNERANIAAAKSGLAYTIWVDTKEKEVLGYWIPDNTESILFTEIKNFDSDKEIKVVVDGKEKVYDLKSGFAKTDIEFNRGKITIATLDDTNFDGYNNNVFGVLYLNDEDEVSKIYAETYTEYGVVDEVKSNKITFQNIANTTASTIVIDESKDSKKVYNVTKDGKEIKISDIEEDDVLFYYSYTSAGNTIYSINVFTDTVEGKVTRLSSDHKVTIDGTKYDDLTSSIKVGDSIIAYLNEDGDILFFEKLEGARGDYAVLSGLREKAEVVVGDGTVVEVKLSTLDGNMTDWKEVDLKATVDEIKKSDAETVKEISGTHAAIVAGDTADGVAVAANATYWTVGSNKYGKKINAGRAYVKALTTGSLYTYKEKSGNVVFTSMLDGDKANLVVGTDGFYSDKASALVNEAGDALNNKVVYFTKNTVVVEVQAADSKGIKEVKVVDIEELDKNTTTFAGQIADLDRDDKEAGVLVITAGSTVKSQKIWSVVLSKEAYEDDDDDSKLDVEYTVVNAGSTKVETLYAETSKADLTEGVVYELTVKGNEITKAKSYSDYSSPEALAELTIGADSFVEEVVAKRNTIKLANFVKDGKVVTTLTGAPLDANDEIKLDENVIVVMLNEDGDYEVSDLDVIKGLKTSDLPYTTGTLDSDQKAANNEVAEDANELTKVVYFTDKDGDSVVVAIVFAEETVLD